MMYYPIVAVTLTFNGGILLVIAVANVCNTLAIAIAIGMASSMGRAAKATTTLLTTNDMTNIPLEMLIEELSIQRKARRKFLS